MDIKQCGSQASRPGPPENFTGTVRIDPLSDTPEPRRVSASSVTFEPGAYCLARASARSDVDRHGRLRMGPELGRPR